MRPARPEETASNLTAETVLPSGQSESGGFAAGSGWDAGGEDGKGVTVFGYIGTGITYTQPLAAAIDHNKIIDVQGGGTLPHCPGVGTADPGYLCLYNCNYSDVNRATATRTHPNSVSPRPGCSSSGKSRKRVGPTWAVSGP